MLVSPKVAWTLTALGAVAGGLIALFLRTPRTSAERAPQPPVQASARHDFQVAEVVFDTGFGKGWDDWGWGPRDKASGGPLRVGFAGYGGVMFHHSELESRFGALVFRFRAPAGFDDFLAASLKRSQAGASPPPTVAVEARHVIDLGDGWKQALIPWQELNPSGASFDRVVIQARSLVAADWVEIDKVVLSKPNVDALIGFPKKPAKLAIDCKGTKLPISPAIYGLSQGAQSANEAARRVGGNTMTRHNWELGAWNVGSDWFFQNVKGDTGIHDWLKGSASDGLTTAVVVPIIGWVAKDGSSFGFPRARFGAQKAHDPKRPEAGNGQRPDGSPLTPGHPGETSIEAPPALIKRWIEAFKKKDAELGGRSIDMYILDNEPDLWHVTHRDVHPEPIGYAELLDRTIRYGTAIREADPGGLIAGPTSWGWPAYFTSSKDSASRFGQVDRIRHGGAPLLAWYLQQLGEHEKRTGTKILDVLDVHFYPQAPGVYEGGAGRVDAETAALRIRSTRALWDPEYVDESWIKDKVRLIPRLKDWVAQNYPGRGISIGEWSFGAEGHISGALAIAEALGRFGQQGLSHAFYWGGLHQDSPAFWAFRAYRNFDGQGGRFLDWSIPSQAAEGLSLFASESGGRVVAILLNLDPTFAVDAEIDTRSCGSLKSQRVFNYAAGTAGLAEAKGRELGKVTAVPYSITVIDLAFAAQR